MGQKTNPTALRLEKTNQHYNSCWYSDRFYSEQLHNNYKTSNYITKVFYKIKKVPYFRAGRAQQQQIVKTKPLIYAKAGHEINQIFCIFPKFKNKYYWRRGNRKVKDTVSRLQRSLNQRHMSCLPMLCALTVYKDKTNRLSLASPVPKDLSQGTLSVQSLQNKAPALVKSQLKGFSQAYSQPMGDLSPLVRALFHKHSWDCQAKLRKQPHLTQEKLSLLNLNRHKVEKHYLARLEQVIESKYHPDFAHRQDARTSFSSQTLSRKIESIDQQSAAPSVDSSQGKFYEKLETPYRVIPSKTRLANLRKRLSQSPPSAIKNYLRKAIGQGNPLTFKSVKKSSLYLLKASFAQQSSQFLAQRISNGLRNRFTFPRLRRQILWDIKKSRYVKGIRVTLSGRVETKSKKAQKARSRTFQWGQTELHVLSSLVQFTSQDLITPRGKIGIKVWICYGG